MGKLKMLGFWVKVLYHLSKYTLRGYTWHMVYVDLHTGDNPNGTPTRKKFVARRTCEGLTLEEVDSGHS